MYFYVKPILCNTCFSFQGDQSDTSRQAKCYYVVCLQGCFNSALYHTVSTLTPISTFNWPSTSYSPAKYLLFALSCFFLCPVVFAEDTIILLRFDKDFWDNWTLGEWPHLRQKVNEDCLSNFLIPFWKIGVKREHSQTPLTEQNWNELRYKIDVEIC